MVRFYAWLTSWSDVLGALWRSKRLFMIGSIGQGLVEYALLIALITVLIIGVVLFAGGRIASTLSSIGTNLGVPAMTAGPTFKPTPTPRPTATPKPTKKPKPTPKPKKSP
jgi:Flp pilus assembly pilin Flp